MQDVNQVYKDGVLISEETVERPLRPNWNAFNLGFISMPEINYILTNTTNKIAVQVLIPLNLSDRVTPQLLKQFWDLIIDGLPILPEPATIDKLNNLAIQTEVPIGFDNNCKLVIN